MNTLTLGSLFDGSGGFPLGGLLAGIAPIWSSEIEPFAIRVTECCLPFVKHYGDINKLSGYTLPPVDIITFGSPCQDMSIAGQRKGLNGSRSNLFYQAIRIITEMRSITNGEYPRYIVWENVLGAFSSNGGEDFRCVLKEICKIKDKSISVPKCSKWEKAGSIVAGDFSLAWRVLDSKYWGVPQRRRRIFLVADFADGRGQEILFESEGLSRYSSESFRTWKRTADSAENCFGAATAEKKHLDERLVIDCYDIRITSDGTKNKRHNVYKTGTSRTIDCSGNPPDRNQGGVAVIAYGIDRAAFNQGKNAKYSFEIAQETEPTLVAKGPGAVAVSKSDDNEYIVRRLTPTECSRLQGFPDWWCKNLENDNPAAEEIKRWRDIFFERNASIGKASKPKSDAQIRKWLKHPHSDSAEYKLWGNGVALPCVYFVMSGIVWHNTHKYTSESLCTSCIDNNSKQS